MQINTFYAGIGNRLSMWQEIRKTMPGEPEKPLETLKFSFRWLISAHSSIIDNFLFRTFLLSPLISFPFTWQLKIELRDRYWQARGYWRLSFQLAEFNFGPGPLKGRSKWFICRVSSLISALISSSISISGIRLSVFGFSYLVSGFSHHPVPQPWLNEIIWWHTQARTHTPS